MFEVSRFIYSIGKRRSPALSFCTQKNSVNLVTGSNGEGKTMFFKALHGDSRVLSGECLYNGENIISRSDFLAYAPVSDYLDYQLTVIEYFNYLRRSANIDMQQAKDLLEKFSMNNHMRTKIKNLSDGEKRRLSIVETCLMNRVICFFDEPEANLDSNFRSIWLRELESLSKEKIIFVISHYPEIYGNIACKTIEINVDEVRISSHQEIKNSDDD